MDRPVLIICATELGKAVLDIFRSNNVVVYGFLDDDKNLHGKEIDNIPVLGSTEDEAYLKIIGKDCDVFIASDDNSWKATLIKSIRNNQKTIPVNAIHKNAIVADSAILHHGSMISNGAIIGAHASVGNHTIIHSGAILDYSAKIGDFVQIGTGSIINSGVVIEDGAFVGSGVTIVSGVTVREGARIGAGSVVIGEVKKNTTVFGNPAKKIQ